MNIIPAIISGLILFVILIKRWLAADKKEKPQIIGHAGKNNQGLSKEQLKFFFSSKTNLELLQILYHKTEYSESAISAVYEELKLRQVLRDEPNNSGEEQRIIQIE